MENTNDQSKPIYTFHLEDIVVQIDGGFIRV